MSLPKWTRNINAPRSLMVKLHCKGLVQFSFNFKRLCPNTHAPGYFLKEVPADMNTVWYKTWEGSALGQESMALLLDSTEGSVLWEVLLSLGPEASSVLGRLDPGGLHTGSLEGDGLSKKLNENLLLVCSVNNNMLQVHLNLSSSIGCCTAKNKFKYKNTRSDLQTAAIF